MTRILCIGEAMAEIRSVGDGFAGDTFNTAVYCRWRLRGAFVAAGGFARGGAAGGL
jgi:hypothetical protein